MEKLLRVHEAAAFLRAHPTSLHRWVREGRIPARKVGNYLLFAQKDLEEFAAPVVPSQPKREEELAAK
jgi:excisionase family DNA binding protein